MNSSQYFCATKMVSLLFCSKKIEERCLLCYYVVCKRRVLATVIFLAVNLTNSNLNDKQCHNYVFHLAMTERNQVKHQNNRMRGTQLVVSSKLTITYLLFLQVILFFTLLYTMVSPEKNNKPPPSYTLSLKVLFMIQFLLSVNLNFKCKTSTTTFVRLKVCFQFDSNTLSLFQSSNYHHIFRMTH